MREGDVQGGGIARAKARGRGELGREDRRREGALSGLWPREGVRTRGWGRGGEKGAQLRSGQKWGQGGVQAPGTRGRCLLPLGEGAGLGVMSSVRDAPGTPSRRQVQGGAGFPGRGRRWKWWEACAGLGREWAVRRGAAQGEASGTRSLKVRRSRGDREAPQGNRKSGQRPGSSPTPTPPDPPGGGGAEQGTC